jgi:hypothetical protein
MKPLQTKLEKALSEIRNIATPSDLTQTVGVEAASKMSNDRRILLPITPLSVRLRLSQLLDCLRRASSYAAAREYERALLEWAYRGETRVTLGSFAYSGLRETFVATVGGRGFAGRLGTVMVTNIRLFGCQLVLEDHFWLRRDRLWDRIEPFFQGERVVMVGTVCEYRRKDQSLDYALDVERLTKLWPTPSRSMLSAAQAA